MCLFQHLTESKLTLSEVWCFSLKDLQIYYLLVLQMIFIYLLLHALKEEKAYEKAGEDTASKYDVFSWYPRTLV